MPARAQFDKDTRFSGSDFAISAQIGTVWEPNCPRAGTESRPYSGFYRFFIFCTDGKSLINQPPFSRREQAPALRVLTSDFWSLNSDRASPRPTVCAYFPFFCTAGACVLAGLCMAGAEARHYASRHLIYLSLRLGGKAADPPPSSEGGTVSSDFWFHHSRGVCPCRTMYGRRRGLPLRVLTSDLCILTSDS